MKEEYKKYVALLVLLIVLFVQLPALIVGGALELFELPIVLSFFAFVIVAMVLLIIRAFYKLDEKRSARVESFFHILILLSLIAQLMFSIVYTNGTAIFYSAILIAACIFGMYYTNKNKKDSH